MTVLILPVYPLDTAMFAVCELKRVYVDDLHQQFIDDAIVQLFEYLAERFEEEVIDELKDEGYVYDDPKTEAEFINEVNNILN